MRALESATDKFCWSERQEFNFIFQQNVMWINLSPLYKCKEYFAYFYMWVCTENIYIMLLAMNESFYNEKHISLIILIWMCWFQLCFFETLKIICLCINFCALYSACTSGTMPLLSSLCKQPSVERVSLPIVKDWTRNFQCRKACDGQQFPTPCAAGLDGEPRSVEFRATHRPCAIHWHLKSVWRLCYLLCSNTAHGWRIKSF